MVSDNVVAFISSPRKPEKKNQNFYFWIIHHFCSIIYRLFLWHITSGSAPFLDRLHNYISRSDFFEVAGFAI
jgi:hypothetical protein